MLQSDSIALQHLYIGIKIILHDDTTNFRSYHTREKVFFKCKYFSFFFFQKADVFTGVFLAQCYLMLIRPYLM